EDAMRMLNTIGYDGPLSVEWEDAGMDRLVGAPQALEIVRGLSFKPSDAAFDAAFSTRRHRHNPCHPRPRAHNRARGRGHGHELVSTLSRRVRRAAQGGAALAGAAALVVVGAAGAGAHVSFTAGVGTAGAYAVLTLSVPHGCDAAPTTEVSIQMPEGINAVTPT